MLSQADAPTRVSLNIALDRREVTVDWGAACMRLWLMISALSPTWPEAASAWSVVATTDLRELIFVTTDV